MKDKNPVDIDAKETNNAKTKRIAKAIDPRMDVNVIFKASLTWKPAKGDS